MRILIFYCAVLLCSAGCKSNKQSSFEVDGYVKNANALVVYLEESSIGSARPVIIDSARLDKEGKFKLSALAKEESIYNLRLPEQPYPFVSFINDSKHITLDVDLKGKEDYTVKGSEASQALKDYLKNTDEKLLFIYNADRAIDSLRKLKVKDSIIGLRLAERSTTVSALKQYTSDIFSKSISPILNIYVLGTYQSTAANPAFGLEQYTYEEINKIIGNTATKFPEHTGVASVYQSMLAEKKRAEAAAATSLVNRQAPDFTLPDVNGNPVSLSSFKGKYVLVDFWASWCGPCRMENPNVVQAYNKFKDKNFTVLGVSLDKPDGKDAWINAIKKDQLTWTHISDLKYWESSVVPLYHFEGIPYNVLVDPTGKVIAESLRGPNLEMKLAEVLK